VDLPAGDGAAGRHERLPGHLAPEHPLTLLSGLHSPEQVDVDHLEIEQADQEI
jgi:hypothetical protein